MGASPERGSGDPGELSRLEQEISAQRKEIEEKNQQIEKLVSFALKRHDQFVAFYFNCVNQYKL